MVLYVMYHGTEFGIYLDNIQTIHKIVLLWNHDQKKKEKKRRKEKKKKRKE